MAMMGLPIQYLTASWTMTIAKVMPLDTKTAAAVCPNPRPSMVTLPLILNIAPERRTYDADNYDYHDRWKNHIAQFAYGLFYRIDVFDLR